MITNKLKVPITALLILLGSISYATPSDDKKKHETSEINGNVFCKDEAVPYANIVIKNTTLGGVSNENGIFSINNIPNGKHTVIVKAMGYKTIEQQLDLIKDIASLNFMLEEDALGIEQVVVTADRSEKKRTEASSIVNTLTPKKLENINAYALSDGLSYLPGLRTEVNCQNCGMVQVRMNGLQGNYSQILINNRPIFSGLVGVYGLELYPVSMIEQVEVIRGGGSALYGSNAIAGTINIITKDPILNSYSAKLQAGSVGVVDGTDAANEYAANFNTSVISNSKNTGITIFGSLRERSPYDANGDGFSELMELKNLSFGSRLFHRINYRSKVTFDFFRINEDRRGGNKFDNLFHESDLTEAVQHEITTGALTYEYFVGTNSMLSVYASAQDVQRGSYYGANQSLNDYGKTSGVSYNTGVQYKSDFGKNSIITGIEATGDKLDDKKMGAPDYSKPIYEGSDIIGFEHTTNSTVAKQDKLIYGAFAQYDRQVGFAKLSAGARIDRYEITDLVNGTGDTEGIAISPRFTALLNIHKSLQGRLSYSQGYRAPQIFDEDLHISASGSRQVIHRNADGLTQETSHSGMASLNYNGILLGRPFSFLSEGFYTYLNDAFTSTPGDVDENGVVTYYRGNAAEGAYVYGVNLEANMQLLKNLNFNLGFTTQRSEYKEPQELGEKSFLRSPNNYGFGTIDWDLNDRLCLIASAQYTGSMKIAYYDQTNTNGAYNGELRNTETFFDFGLKGEYELNIKDLPLKVFVGAKNIFNCFQSDFEVGADRDPTYVYGPGAPRTIYCGISLSDIF